MSSFKDLIKELVYRIHQSTTSGEDIEEDSLDYWEEGLHETKEKKIVIKRGNYDNDINSLALAMSVEDCSVLSIEDNPKKFKVLGLFHTIEFT